MIAVLLVLAVALDVTCMSVVGFTPSTPPAALIESDTEGPTHSPSSVAAIEFVTEGPTSSPISVALKEPVTEGPTFSPTESYRHLYDDTYNSDYPDCNGYSSYIRDGECDSENNNVECGWDGGDCCDCTCQSTARYHCSYEDYDCKDPRANFHIPSPVCKNVSLPIPKVSTCPHDVQIEWVVNDTAAANSLAEAMLCFGGNFEVEWTGHIILTRTIYVHDGASLRITGVLDAIADGGGTVQVLVVSNGYLYLKNLEIVNGNASSGGAIFVASESELFVEGVSFSFNTANDIGGAVYATSSNITLVSTAFSYNIAGYGGAIFAVNSSITGSVNARFHGNHADYGGAVFVLSSIVIGSGNMTLTSNNVTENGGALYIGRSSYVGWNMENVTVSTYSSTYGDLSDDDSSVNRSYTTSAYDAYMPYPYWNEAEWIDKSNVGDTTIFMDNIAGGIGGAIYAEYSKISWSGPLLLENNSAQYGGAFYLENGVIFQTRGKTSFCSNSALYDGGAIGAADEAGTYFGHSWLILNGSTIFIGNTCGGNGGAIDLSDIHVVFDGKIVFSANSAASSGGALYASQKEYGPTLTGVCFSNNTAEAGGAVFFSAVGPYEDSTTDDNEISYRSSSKFIDCRFDGNSASSTGGAVHSIAGKDLVWGTDFIKNTADFGGALRVSGVIVFLNSSFVENKSGEAGGPAISNGGAILKMDGLIFSGNGYQCSADAFMDLNEITADQSRYETVCDGCGAQEKCSRCTVKDSNHTLVCTEVFDHTDSQDGAATLETLVLEAGYWRATNSSRQILACFNKNACGGGLTGNPDSCSTGYEGPYCAVCSQRYAATLSYYGCSECSEMTSIVPSVCAAIIVGLLGLLLVRHMVSIEGEHRTTWFSVDQIKAVLPLQSFKIIIVSWQIVTQFSLVANVVYPRLYQRLLNVITLANFDLGWIPSAACIMDVDFHVELIAATVGPLVLLALLGLTYIIALHRNRGSERALSAVRRKHANATIIVALLLYSMASSAVFRAFACDSLDDGKVYLRSDYRIECNSPRHRMFQIYAIFMLVAYPLGIPVVFALLLFRRRKALVDTSLRNDTRDLLQQSTSNLWKPYKPSAFYYEVVECSRRVMLTGVVVFIYPSTAAQIAITLAIAFIFAFTSERLDPYDSHWDGWVSRIGHVMVVLTMYVALLAKIDVSNEGSQSQALLAGILVAAHITMVLGAVAEAIVLVCSVRERDTPLPRTRTNQVVPVDDFSSIQSYSVGDRMWQREGPGTTPS